MTMSIVSFVSSSVAIATAAVLCAGVPLATAGADPGDKCATSKHKAAAKKLSAMLKCHDVAILKGAAVDQACLDKAELKFNEAFAKAEAGGGCSVTGNATTADQIINDAVADLLAALPGAADPENCNNAADDDFDGQADCRDQDCAAEPKCTDDGTGESGNLPCSNNVDEDADTFIDCSDFQCQPYTVCGGWNPDDF